MRFDNEEENHLQKVSIKRIVFNYGEKNKFPVDAFPSFFKTVEVNESSINTSAPSLIDTQCCLATVMISLTCLKDFRCRADP